MRISRRRRHSQEGRVSVVVAIDPSLTSGLLVGGTPSTGSILHRDVGGMSSRRRALPRGLSGACQADRLDGGPLRAACGGMAEVTDMSQMASMAMPQPRSKGCWRRKMAGPWDAVVATVNSVVDLIGRASDGVVKVIDNIRKING